MSDTGVGQASPDFLSSTLNASARMVFVHDTLQNRFQLLGAVKSLTGRESEEITCLEDFLALVHPDDQARINQYAGQVGAVTSWKAVHFRLVHANGEQVPCFTYGELFTPLSKGGALRTGFISLVDERHPEETQASRLAELTEYLPELVSLHSSDGRTLSLNASGRKLLGISRSADVSRLWLDDLVAETATVPAHLLLSVVLAHGSHSSEVVLLNQRDGAHVPAYWSGTVISDHDKGKSIVVCTARNMTRQLETEWELRENQRRLTHALEVSQLGEWSMDINTQSGRQSPRVAEIFGDGVEENWNYRVFLRHVHPEDRERVEKQFKASLDTARDVDFEARIIRRDGEHRWINAKASMTHGLTGERKVFGGVIQDISAQKFTEQRNRLLADLSQPLATLRDERRMLREVMQLLVPLLADQLTFDIFDQENTLIRELSTTSLLSCEAIGSPHTTVENLPVLAARSLSQRQTERLTVFEGRGLEQFARTESELLSLRGLDVCTGLCVPLHVRDRSIGFLNLYRVGAALLFSEAETELASEIGLRVSVALENARLYRALRENDERKNEFLAMLSHEIRNPLESLDAGVSLYEDLDDGSSRTAATSIMMRRQINKLSALLDDLLDLSRYAIDKVVLRRTFVELQSLLEASVSEYRSRRGATDYEWVLNVPETPVHVHADSIRLSQVFSNLLSNALKYGASRGTIEVSLLVDGQQARIIVKDDGVGIAADQLPSVFDLFVQGATTIDRARGGLGMGLTLVRKIVELHGGEVQAYSDGIDQGTRIEIVLDIALQNSQPVAKKLPEIVNASGKKLLLVDDNLETVGALAKLFLRLDYDVRVAHDGRDAITIANEFKPEMAVLDIGLPRASGYEVAEALRASYGTDPLLLIALSGYGQAQDRERSQVSGFDHHLLKPVEFRTIALLLQGLDT